MIIANHWWRASRGTTQHDYESPGVEMILKWAEQIIDIINLSKKMLISFFLKAKLDVAKVHIFLKNLNKNEPFQIIIKRVLMYKARLFINIL